MRADLYVSTALMLGILASAGCTTAPSRPGSPPIVIRDFSYPWEDRVPPRTEFEAALAGDRFEFRFDVVDRTPVVSADWRGESTLDAEDRVEIFFAADPALERYYCIEIDPLGRVHDYAASSYRKFDSGWNCQGLMIRSHPTADGYRIDGSIPVATLESLLKVPVGHGTTLRIGVFRADFYGTGPAAHGEVADNWISWVRPATMSPDFHVPSAFREVRLP